MDFNQPGSLKRGRHTQQRLDEANQCYLECIADLWPGNDSTHNHSDIASFKAIAIEVHQDLYATLPQINKPQQSKGILKITHPAPGVLPLVNRLPPEVLLQIFWLVVCQKTCVLYNPSLLMPNFGRYPNLQSLLALTHVHRHWRTIIVNTPLFWSHVNLKFGCLEKFFKTCNLIEVCLERSHTLPLCIRVVGQGQFFRRDLKKLTGCLHPHLGNLAALHIEYMPDYNQILELITFWLMNGRPGSVHALSVQQHKFESRWKLHPTDRELNQQRLNSFLQPIRMLRLYRAYFDWDSSVYHNLVVLQLGGLARGSQDCPTLQQMLGILLACPQLHTLQLQYMSILASEPAPLEPVVLSALKHLELLNVEPNSLCRLLPMIVPQSQQLNIKISINVLPYLDQALSDSALQSFLIRSDVTRLYIRGLDNIDRIAGYLSAVQDLNTLILDCNHGKGDEFLAAFTSHPELNSERLPRCPSLRTLYLINGYFSNASLQKMVEEHRLVKKLRFISCTFGSSFEQLLFGLKPLVGDIRCESEQSEGLTHWYKCLA